MGSRKEETRPEWQTEKDGYFRATVSNRRLEPDLVKRQDYSGFHAFAEQLGDPSLTDSTPRGRRGNWDVEKAREWQKEAEVALSQVTIESPPKPWEVHNLLDLTTIEDWDKVISVTTTALSDFNRGRDPAIDDQYGRAHQRPERRLQAFW